MTSLEYTFMNSFSGLSQAEIDHINQNGVNQINSIELMSRLMALKEAERMMAELREETEV